jgi:EmrB/QacA subfamily drug resistance transporter
VDDRSSSIVLFSRSQQRLRKETIVSRSRTLLATIGILVGLFMASMEATVVATAMPTIVSQLGGLSIYSWVFSVYMLASTTTVPLYGKLSDIYGRRPVYLAAMVLFLGGSVLCGMAQSMEQLIAFRALQGLGAGGVLPLVFIIVGDIFNFEQRARMQGFFSGVWGISSIAGPLLGGFLVDQVSWPWVFYVNVLPGIIATFLVWITLEDRHVDRSVKPSIDFAGAVVMSAAVVSLLLGLSELGTPLGWSLLVTAMALLGLLLWLEMRARDPVLPLRLFRDRLFATATGHGVLAGWAMFGSLSFVPLFVQAVLGTSATEAGSTLMPLMLGWVGASIIGSRLLLRMGYRSLAVFGMGLLTLGAFLMAVVGTSSTRPLIMLFLGMMGVGMGFSIPPFLIAVQSKVPKRDMGTATSTLQFSRSIGGTLGVSVMGAVLSVRLANALTGAGLDPAAVSLNSLIDPLAAPTATAFDTALRTALATAMQGVFYIAFVAAGLGFLVTMLAPGGQISQITPAAPPAQPEPTPTAPPEGVRVGE